MSSAIIVRDDVGLKVWFGAEAQQQKDIALEKAAIIGKVTNADDQREAVEAQKALAELLSVVEKARKEAKEPILNFGRLIDFTAQKFTEDLKAEQLRIARLVGDFQALEQRRIWAAQQAENERLAQLEREKAAELAKAASLEEVNKVQEVFNNRAQAEAVPIPQATRTEGQRVTQEWVIEITDPWLLARSHPTCVKIEPLKSEIKELLNAGVQVKGVRATKETKAGVRVGARPRLIEV